MQKLIMLIAIVSLMAIPAMAGPGTLYDQEGDATYDADPVEVDGAGSMPTSYSAANNWVHQYGSYTTVDVYAGSSAWVHISDTGTTDGDIAVEADVELYMSQSVSNNKIYFHLGNVFNATTDDKTAFVDGSFTTNNGMYIGISFFGTTKSEADFEKDTLGKFTGKIIGGMQSDHDSWRTNQDNQMDILFLLNWGAGWVPPVTYGDGAHETVKDTLWWLVDNGGTGTYNYQWLVRLLPTADQADGDYYLDPTVVSAPVL